jgi:hypothetical protein
MAEASSIFREEALEARAAAQRVSGEPLRVDPRWVRLSYWVVLILVVAGVATGMLVRTDATATGPAVIHPDGTFSAVIPATVATQLEGARSLRIESSGPGSSVNGSATIDHIAAASDASVSRAHLPPLKQPGIMLSGVLTDVDRSAISRLHTDIKAHAALVLRSDSLLGTIGRRLDGMLG